MDFKYGDLERLFGKIQATINMFEQEKFENRTFKIYLANGERINYRVSKDSIPHLLGVHVEYLINIGIFKKNSAFELLKVMCENAYRINSWKNEKRLDYNRLFDDHIIQKIDAFNQNIRINIDETEVVSKYDPERIFNAGIETEKNLEYIIIKKRDGKYYMLWLAKSIYDKYYYPMSNRVFDTFEEMNDQLQNLMRNQEITYINGVTLSNTETDYNKNFTLPIESIRPKISILKGYKEKYSASIDTADSLMYSANQSIKHKDKHFENFDLINSLTKAIENGNLVDITIFENTMIESTAEVWNNFLCSKNIKGNENAKDSYSKLIKELSKLKELLKETQMKLNDAKLSNEILTNENKELIESNTELSEIVDGVKLLVNKK